MTIQECEKRNAQIIQNAMLWANNEKCEPLEILDVSVIAEVLKINLPACFRNFYNTDRPGNIRAVSSHKTILKTLDKIQDKLLKNMYPKQFIHNGSRYIFLTIKQLAMAVATAPIDVDFDFTFDTEAEVRRTNDATGWYGVKRKLLFDEEQGALCFGYYGGGFTQCIDMDAISDNTYDIPTNAVAITSQLKKWLSNVPELFDGKLCVEITEANAFYFREYNYFVK